MRDFVLKKAKHYRFLNILEADRDGRKTDVSCFLPHFAFYSYWKLKGILKKVIRNFQDLVQIEMRLAQKSVPVEIIFFVMAHVEANESGQDFSTFL